MLKLEQKLILHQEGILVSIQLTDEELTSEGEFYEALITSFYRLFTAPDLKTGLHKEGAHKSGNTVRDRKLDTYDLFFEISSPISEQILVVLNVLIFVIVVRSLIYRQWWSQTVLRCIPWSSAAYASRPENFAVSSVSGNKTRAMSAAPESRKNAFPVRDSITSPPTKIS
jgi:hypothetical protein